MVDNSLDYKIFVGVPHTIKIVKNGRFNPDKRKFTTDEPIYGASLQSSGTLSAKLETRYIGTTIDGIPIYTKNPSYCDSLPQGYDIYIVSQVYAKIYTQIYGYNEKLYCVSDTVYTNDGRTMLGSRGICPYY